MFEEGYHGKMLLSTYTVIVIVPEWRISNLRGIFPM